MAKRKHHGPTEEQSKFQDKLIKWGLRAMAVAFIPLLIWVFVVTRQGYTSTPHIKQWKTPEYKPDPHETYYPTKGRILRRD